MEPDRGTGSRQEPATETRRESRRAVELREALGEATVLAPADVTAGLVALAEAIRHRFSPAIEVALFSWVPECWVLATRPRNRDAAHQVRGREALVRWMVDAGMPEGVVEPFLATFMRHVSRRCGTPLADQVVRRVPELEEFLREGEPAPTH